MNARTAGFTLILALALGPVLGRSTVVGAQSNLNARLHGQYAYAGNRHCITSTLPLEGLSGLQLPIGAGVSSSPSAESGVFDFHGDGTGTLAVRVQSLFVNAQPPAIPVTVSENTCSVAYSVSADGSVILQRECSFTSVVGPVVGTTGTVTGVETRLQIIDRDTAALESPAERPIVETFTNIPPGGGVTSTFYRVCARFGMLSKLRPH